MSHVTSNNTFNKKESRDLWKYIYYWKSSRGHLHIKEVM